MPSIAVIEKAGKKSRILQYSRINIYHEHSKSFGQIDCKVS